MKTKVKICGITNVEDAQNAIRLGADYIGYIFYKKSPRYVKPEVVARINEMVSGATKRIGVFVNEQPAGIIRTVKKAGLDMVQLHSVLNDNTYEEMNRSNIPYIKVIRVKNEPIQSDDLLKDIKNCYAYLFDTYDSTVFGGTGKKFDWAVAKSAAVKTKVFLSGGLDEKNVKNAIKEVKPYAVDVCSGVELSPGKKDALRMELFILRAKGLI